MAALRCTIARTPGQIADAQRVRWQVYGEEERLLPTSAAVEDGREIDAHDEDDAAVHVLVYAGDEAVGTVRLLQARAGAGHVRGGRLGLDLDAKLDLGALCRAGVVPAEITRYCVLRRYRCTSVAKMLYEGLRSESRSRAITCWLAAANMETDYAEDAALAYELLCARNLVDGGWRAKPRSTPLVRSHRRRPCYTDEQRVSAARGRGAELPLPRTLALFAVRMGARFIGSPMYDDYFNVFALPLIASPSGAHFRVT
jgi:putative hemolysin